MSIFQRILNWFLRLIGMGGVAKLTTDVHKLNQQVQSGNYQGMMAGAQALSQNAQSGAYGGPAGGGGVVVTIAGPNPFANQQMQNAMVQSAMTGAMASHQANVNAATAANPALVAPIEGLTIEQYAGLAAKAASGMSQGDFDMFLAQNGLDRAKYDRVAEGWNARMRDDGTHSLVTIYGRAFGGAGAGQFGAAGAAGAASLGQTAATGQGAGVGAGEPVSWEKYNEIGGAQRAWSTSGKDVNAMLKQTFNVSALDWSNMSQYWMARMMTDPQKMMEMNTLQEQWAAKYASAKADTDLTF